MNVIGAYRGICLVYTYMLYIVKHSRLGCLGIKRVAEMARQKTLQFNMRMTPQLKEAAEEAAADDQRSVASLIEKLLTDYCKEKGFLTDPSKKRR